MSVMLPQLSKAIMSICSALFIESLTMFSHETPDPSNQSPLSEHWKYACIIIFFFTSTAALPQGKWKFKKVRNMLIFKKPMCLCNLHLYL